jgi:hypothetical protein
MNRPANQSLRVTLSDGLSRKLNKRSITVSVSLMYRRNGNPSGEPATSHSRIRRDNRFHDDFGFRV